jgi:hypothetical protein
LGTKRDPKQLRSVDVAITIRNSIGMPVVESTCRALASYFKGGGRDLGYEKAIRLGIAVLFKQKTRAQAEAEIEEFSNSEARRQCQQVLSAILKTYEGRVSNFELIPSRWIRVRAGIGLYLPMAILTKVDGKKRFVIFQPRRGRAPLGDRAGFLLSMFIERYSVNEEYGVGAEILDMQCPKRTTKRFIQVIHSEVVRRFSKGRIDEILTVYAAAMERLIKAPERYGVKPDISRDVQHEMDEIWTP